MASKLGGHSLICDPPLKKVGGSFDPPDPPGSPPLLQQLTKPKFVVDISQTKHTVHVMHDEIQLY